MIPVVYSLIDDTRGWIPGMFRWVGRTKSAAPGAVVEPAMEVNRHVEPELSDVATTNRVPVGTSAEIDVAVNHQKG